MSVGRPDPASGSTGDYPRPTEPHGSSLVELIAGRPVPTDDAPTLITPSNPPPGPRLVDNPAAHAARLAGQKLGHFELMEAIGTGGMATVLKARDLELGRVVALKILPPDTARDPEAVSRFKQEARAAAKLDHDNVARVYFCGEDRGLHFIAFEFVEGENLRQRIDRLGTLSASDAVSFMLQLSAGLGHAADRGVVHRDVKPSNILVTPDGKAKLVDMGLARHLSGGSVNGGVTQSGVTLGTFDYISPEQALDPRRADVRSDIYSLGCAFYHALTGRPPVPDGTAAKKLHAHQHEPPIDPRDLNPQVPDPLAVLLGRMMAKDPARRPQTPADLTRELYAVARQVGLPVEPSPADTGAHSQLTATPAEPPQRLPVGLVIGLSAAAVAAAILFGVPKPGPASAPPWGDPPAAKSNPPAEPTEPVLPAATGDPSRRVVGTADELAAALRADGVQAVQLKPGRYDLTKLPDGATFAGRSLTLEPVPPGVGAEPAGPPVVILSAAPASDMRPGSLTFRGAKSVTVRGLDIRIDAVRDEFAADPVGVLFRDCERVELVSVLVRATDEARAERVTGISADAGPGVAPPAVSVKHALFDLGKSGVGVRLPDGAAAEFAEVGFGPVAAAVELTDADAMMPGRVRFAGCTFMFDRGSAAVSAERGADAEVTAGGCVFAAAGPPPDPDRMMMGMADGRPVVLRLLDAETPIGGVRFAAAASPPNAYFQVEAIETAARHHPFAEFLGQPTPPAADPTAVTLTRPPWDHPTPHGVRLAGDDPWAAFRLRIKQDERLRVPPPVYVLGVTDGRGPGQHIYPGAWPPEKPTLPVSAGPGQRVVYPDADPEHAAKKVYPDLAKALDDAQPGDDILIAATGKLVTPGGLRPRVKRASVTIRPYPEYDPLIVSDAAGPLFAVTDGAIEFAHLRFEVGGRQPVAAIAGGRGVTFRHCLVTLREDGDDDPAAAVALLAIDREMPRAGDPDGPAVRFDHTLVRGRGRAVWAQAPRPFAVSADQSAFVLDGGLLVCDAGRADRREAAGERPTLSLTRVTTILSGPLLDVRGRLVPAVDSSRCVFAPLDGRLTPRPLVAIESPDAADPKSLLAWSAGGPSVYAEFDRHPVLEVRTPDAATELAFDAWKAFAGETGKTAAVKFPKLKGSRPAKGADVVPVIDDRRADDTGADASRLGPGN